MATGQQMHAVTTNGGGNFRTPCRTWLVIVQSFLFEAFAAVNGQPGGVSMEFTKTLGVS